MNLIFQPSPGGKGGTIDQPLGGKTLDDATVLVFVTAKRTAKNSEKTVALDELNAACAQAEREEAMLGSGSQTTGTIQQLVATITRLEGELEHLDRAYTALGGS